MGLTDISFQAQTGIGHRSFVKDARLHYQYMNYLKCSHFDKDSHSNVEDVFSLVFKVSDKTYRTLKIHTAETWQNWIFLMALKLFVECFDILKTVRWFLWNKNTSGRMLHRINLVW